MMFRRHALIAVAAAAALLLAACGANERDQGDAGAAPAKGGTLYLLADQSRVEFDPAKSSSLVITALSLVHRRLTSWQLGKGGPTTVVPDLATDTGRPTDGGRTWSFTLKDGVKFSDGTPITAADVKWGVERSFAPAFSGGLAYHKALLQGGTAYKGPFDGGDLASIETPDARTIVFHLARPYGDWKWIASTPAFAPVPKGKGADATYSENAVSSGPYMIGTYQKGVQIDLVRNPNWDAATDPTRTALPDRIEFQLGQQTTVISKRLVDDTGEDQAAFGTSFVSPAQLAQVQNNSEARQRLVTSQSGALAYLALNTQRGVLADPKVRQAFQYAVDKAAYQVASAGGAALAGDTASTLITPGIEGREPYDLYPEPAAGDPDKARQMLAAAGHPDGLKGLTLLVTNANGYPEKAAAVQAALARAGITVTIRTLDEQAYDGETITAANPTYDLTLTSWQADYPSAGANIQPLFASTEIGGGGYNVSRYRNPGVDTAIEDAQSTVDAAEAGRKWAAIDRTIMADSPVVPLIYTRNSFLAGSRVGGVTIGDFPAYVDYRVLGLRP